MSRIITTSVLILLPFILFGQEETLSYAEEMPVFAKCEDVSDQIEQKKCADKKMYEYIYSKLIYPIQAWENEVSGLVIISFIVAKNGNLLDVKVEKDIGSGCGEAAVKAVRSMPKWIPGKHEGNVVRVRMNIPIKFGEGVHGGGFSGGNGNGLITNTMKLKRFSSKVDWSVLTSSGIAKGNFDSAPNFDGCSEESEAASGKCTEKRLKTFLEEQMVYPELAWEKGYENTINVGFVINKDGSISDAKIYSQSTNENYEAPFKTLIGEAKNLIKQMPNWNAATKEGEAVLSYYFMPIQFDILKYNRAQRKKQKKAAK